MLSSTSCRLPYAFPTRLCCAHASNQHSNVCFAMLLRTARNQKGCQVFVRGGWSALPRHSFGTGLVKDAIASAKSTRVILLMVNCRDRLLHSSPFPTGSTLGCCMGLWKEHAQHVNKQEPTWRAQGSLTQRSKTMKR